MSTKEYLSLFSNKGDFTTNVKFKKSPAMIAQQRFDSEEILSLIDPSTGTFFTEMTFDDHPFRIEKYEIDPVKKALTIHAVSD